MDKKLYHGFRYKAPEGAESCPPVNIDDKLMTLKYWVDEEYAHIRIRDEKVCLGCKTKPCLIFCPVGVYRENSPGRVTAAFQACIECGSCRIMCIGSNIDWTLPQNGNGISFKFG